MTYKGLERICYKAIVKNRHYIYHKYEVEHINNIFRLWHYSTMILAVDTLNKRLLSFCVTSVSDAQAISKALYVLNTERNTDLWLRRDCIYKGLDIVYTRDGKELRYCPAERLYIKGKPYWYVEKWNKIMRASRKFKQVHLASDGWFYDRYMLNRIAQYQKPKNHKQLLELAKQAKAIMVF